MNKVVAVLVKSPFENLKNAYYRALLLKKEAGVTPCVTCRHLGHTTLQPGNGMLNRAVCRHAENRMWGLYFLSETVPSPVDRILARDPTCSARYEPRRLVKFMAALQALGLALRK